MNQIKESFDKEYALLLEQQAFPEVLREEFVPEACIGSSENGETWLFRCSDTGQRYVVKVRSANQRYRVDIEERMLVRLQELNIPAPRLLKRIDAGDKIFLVREYVEGQTLEEYCHSREAWSEWETIEIGMAVCEQLEQLQSVSPPIVHRDIKPQNIVITPDRQVRLIDFDTARVYEEGKAQDTYFFGTEQTASPEQYGFEQTDGRTDLYGLGKTLLYLTCGSYDNAALEKAHCSEGFKQVIRKSVSLLKDQRYRSAAEMYRQLDRCRKAALYRRRRIFLGVAALLAVLALVCVGGAGYWRMRADRIVHFESQMLETAVREALLFDEGREITYADLERVYELRMIGTVPFGAGSTYYYQDVECPDHIRDDKYNEKGDIADISLLAHMPNLKRVYLCNQYITDLSPLKDLELTDLALSGNHIMDFSVVSQMDSLRSLYIGGNPVQNLNFLEGNSTLRLLNLGSTSIESFEPLTGTQIEDLWIMGCTVMDGDYTALSGMEQLCHLYTLNFSEEQMRGLSGSKNLRELYLWGDSGATDLKGLDNVDSLELLVMGEQFRSVDGIGNLKGLHKLISGKYAVDLTALAESSSVRELDLFSHDAVVQDYTPVVEHPGLTKVLCNEKQMEEMLRLRPDMNTLELGTW
ncbi:MAG: protein kinase [Roseburia sp.]|nr:protein kinase [Roseburia sp.]